MVGAAGWSGERRWRRVCGGVSIFLAALVLAGCAIAERSAARRVRDRIAAIRAAGEPVTFEELRAGQPSRGEEDAAVDYRAAFALLTEVDGRPLLELLNAYHPGARSCPLAPPSAELRARARGMLARSRPALELIDQAARKDDCHFAFKVERDGIPRFSPFRVASALLTLRTLERAFAGDANGAAASLVSKLRMLRVFETEPILIAYLVRLPLWMQACADLPAVFANGSLSGASLDQLERALKEAEAPDLLKRTMEGERVFEMMFLSQLLGPDWPDGGVLSDTTGRRPLQERTRFLRYAGYYLGEIAGTIGAAGEPWPQVLEAMPGTIPSFKLFEASNVHRPDPSMDSSILMRITGQALAATRAGRVAVALEQFRRGQGRRPASLAELASPLPLDPFTGHDLLYARRDDGYVIASVGPARAAEARALDEDNRPQGLRVCLRTQPR